MVNDSIANWLSEAIRQACRGADNNLYPAEARSSDFVGEPAWGEPLIGFSGGADPLYAQFKTAVGPFHWTPLEAWQEAFPGEAVSSEELTVICWVLPQTAATREDNARQTRYPAERWARSRIYGEEFNKKLRQDVVTVLQSAGYAAMSPMLLPQWKTLPSEAYVWASTWSERHVAYASGLGTFGLCDGLITAVGKAVRIGSAVARVAIPPTPRPYTHHRAYCLFFGTPRSCGECIARCPAGALSEQGHDKRKCSAFLDRVTAEHVRASYGFDGYGCGLCQTGVPCEARVPQSQIPRTPDSLL